jgi:hypothetical protein
MRVEDLDASGLIYHPVKQEAPMALRPKAIPNVPKVKLWIVINSFNSAFYISACMRLAVEIRKHLDEMVPRPRILLVFGGSTSRRVDVVFGITVARIDKNLSDYGAFVGVHDTVKAGIIGRYDRCVLLHDTVWPREGRFLEAMIDVQNAKRTTLPFLHAHPLGWYNLGIGRADFFENIGAEYAKVQSIPKQLGYELEHGKSLTFGEVILKPLREYSKYTIARHRVGAGDIDALTTHSTGAVVIQGKSRVVVYVASLGIFKLSHGPTSYQVPIYSDYDLPCTEKDWYAMRMKYPQMDWCLPLLEVDPNEW